MDKRPRDGDTPGAEKNARYAREAQESVDKKQDEDRTSPVVKPASAKVKTDASEKKNLDGYVAHADNDGKFHLDPLDDGTNVKAGHVMENQAREPAHQQHELAVEKDAPGYEQAAALMLPRGNPHYNEGGSIAEVKADEEA